MVMLPLKRKRVRKRNPRRPKPRIHQRCFAIRDDTGRPVSVQHGEQRTIHDYTPEIRSRI